ncbi:MAG: Na+/H+ antiporter [Oscillospiraceae bacterium]|nr:Na+/H+ antiporter [Oscillospiraceae bacterium]
MQTFVFILVLLTAVLVSNPINRFVPVLSVPIVQIILGALITFIPFSEFGFEFEFEPEFFFVLFIAPLIFHAGMMFDKRTMLKVLGPILSSAFLLVFISVLAIGFLLNFLAPVIPLAVAFVLIAALSPTDDVAVDAVTKQAAVPKKIMTILSGESVINDASGIVSFQFAVLVVTTGVFSPLHMAEDFILIGLGGIAIGVAFSGLKYIIVKWLRNVGIENATLHILLGILSPFVIFIIAHRLHLSGVLAVFASGLIHSLVQDKFNPDSVKLHIAGESVWKVLSFSLEGIVFILLGLQLPGILKDLTDHQDIHDVNDGSIIVLILLLTLAFAVLRFIWWIVTVRPVKYEEQDIPTEPKIGRIRSGLIFSLSGARGTVTLACILSVPLTLSDGSPFPERELLILLASGVIVCSLLITNFLLPLVAKKEEKHSQAYEQVHAEIVQGVIARLLSDANDKNHQEISVIVDHYRKRDILRHGHYSRKTRKAEENLRGQILLWEKENTLNMLKNKTVDESAARYFLKRLETIELAKKYGLLYKIVSFLKQRKAKPEGDIPEEITSSMKIAELNFKAIREGNALFVLDKLKAAKTDENGDAVDRLRAFYELSHKLAESIQQSAYNVSRETKKRGNSLVIEVAAKAFKIERGLIQEMLEVGRISRETAKEMRSNIIAMEARTINN